jgi:hypothetical protein
MSAAATLLACENVMAVSIEEEDFVSEARFCDGATAGDPCIKNKIIAAMITTAIMTTKTSGENPRVYIFIIGK